VTRLAPLVPEQFDDDTRGALRQAFGEAAADRLLASGPDARPLPTVLGTLLRHPALAGPFLAYNNVLLQRPTIDARLRELVILRVAWRAHAVYEWAQHVRVATGLGVTRDEIDAIAARTDSVVWSPLEAAALAATDELVDGHRIDDDTWSQLAKELDDRQLIELVFVIGTYAALAMAFNSFELELDDELREIAATTFSTPEE
jgi:alkylhydroperoxidase family enzyme